MGITRSKVISVFDKIFEVAVLAHRQRGSNQVVLQNLSQVPWPGHCYPKATPKMMGTGFPKGRRLYVSALQIWQGSGSFRQWLYSPVYFSMNYRAKENLGYLYIYILIVTFQSTSNVFQSWSERVRKSFLRENRGSSVISIQLHSSPDCQHEFDMNPLYPEGPS